MILHCLVFLGLLFGGTSPKTSLDEPQSPTACDEALQVLVYQRLYKDACVVKYKPRKVLLCFSTGTPSQKVVRQVAKTLPIPVEGVPYKEDGGEDDRGATPPQIPAMRMTLTEVEYAGKDSCMVGTSFHSLYNFGGSIAYRAKRRGGKWSIVGTQARLGREAHGAYWGKIAGHTYRITIEKRTFIPNGHHIRFVMQKHKGIVEDFRYYIDGYKAKGSVYNVDDYISRFEVEVDGVKWKISPALYRDLHQLNNEKSKFYSSKKSGRPPRNIEEMYEPPNGRHIWLSGDGKRLWFLCGGSDGGCSYTVLWQFQADGNSSRQLVGEM